MKTLIFIHGADSFIQDEEYLWYLESIYIPRQSTPWEDKVKTDYRTSIAKSWQAQCWRVYYPTMPQKQNARYRDWKMVFNGIMSTINPEDEITFIGTSLGGCFLLKYFSEVPIITKNEAIQDSGTTRTGLLRTSQWQEQTWKNLKIHQIHLLAACISEWDFTAPDNYEYLQQLENRVHIWHAQDDTVVPFSIAETLAQVLPDAQTHFFNSEKGYWHFHGVESIPELESEIFANKIDLL